MVKIDQNGEKKKANSDVSRRQVVRMIGAVGGSGIAGNFATPTEATASAEASATVERITGNELDSLARQVVNSQDVRNVGRGTVRKTIQTGTTVGLSENDQSHLVATRGSPEDVKENGTTNLAETDILVSAGRHTMESGTERTVVALISGDEQVIWHTNFATAKEGVMSKARLWSIRNGESLEEARLVLKELSVNGKQTKQPSDFATNSCSGCEPGPTGGGYRGQDECVDMNMQCAIPACSACVYACGNLLSCLSCLSIYCPTLLTVCCNEWDTTCEYCVGMTET